MKSHIIETIIHSDTRIIYHVFITKRGHSYAIDSSYQTDRNLSSLTLNPVARIPPGVATTDFQHPSFRHSVWVATPNGTLSVQVPRAPNLVLTP